MIRRDFLTTLLSSNLFNLFKFESDADKLIGKIEKETIYDSFLGDVPFKLYEYQKNIIRQICENDKVIFLKARQIGITTLLDAYARHTDIDYKSNAKHAAPRAYKYTYFSENQAIAEEINFEPRRWQPNAFKKIINNLEKKEKIVIAGSVDPYGNMKWAKDNAKKYGFKFFTYTINDCKHEWDAKKIERLNYLKSLVTYPIWAKEMECKL